jgi:hypothetical protein
MTGIIDDLERIEISPKSDTPYFKYTCRGCGKEGRNTYCEPSYTQMMERRLCWDCNYWREAEAKYTKEHTTMTIIDGHVYGPGNRTSGSMRGMAGRRFDIEYIEPSVYAGQRVTTFDLWSGSALPDNLRAKFPDTARFLGGAEKATWPEGSLYTAAWNPSDSRSEPYPLPNTLRPNVAKSSPQDSSQGGA